MNHIHPRSILLFNTLHPTRKLCFAKLVFFRCLWSFIYTSWTLFRHQFSIYVYFKLWFMFQIIHFIMFYFIFSQSHKNKTENLSDCSPKTVQIFTGPYFCPRVLSTQPLWTLSSSSSGGAGLSPLFIRALIENEEDATCHLFMWEADDAFALPVRMEDGELPPNEVFSFSSRQNFVITKLFVISNHKVVCGGGVICSRTPSLFKQETRRRLLPNPTLRVQPILNILKFEPQQIASSNVDQKQVLVLGELLYNLLLDRLKPRIFIFYSRCWEFLHILFLSPQNQTYLVWTLIGIVQIVRLQILQKELKWQTKDNFFRIFFSLTLRAPMRNTLSPLHPPHLISGGGADLATTIPSVPQNRKIKLFDWLCFAMKQSLQIQVAVFVPDFHTGHWRTYEMNSMPLLTFSGEAQKI